MSEKEKDIIEEVKAYKELDEISKDYQNAEDRLNKFIKKLEKRRDDAHTLIKEYAEKEKWTRFLPEYLPNFLEESYVIEPKRFGKGGHVLEWYVYVPKFVKFHVGRLERATHSYNVFSVTQYMHHFADIPEELSSRFPKLDIELKVVDGLLITDVKDTDTAWTRYKKYLFRREGPGRILIKKGSEWDIIAKILEDGGLPFVPQPVDKKDFRPRSYGGFACHAEWKVRDYQKEAIQKFHEYGAVGIYFPFGTGKSELGLDLIDQLKGIKLVIVNTLTLKEQWIERLELLPENRKNEVHIVTYHGFNQIQRLMKQHKEFTLIVFDEVHHLPAKTFMRLSTIPTKYRLGLTGSPYREDGHINYILALTGFPLGLAWSRFVSEGIISLAQIQVHVVKKLRHKLALLDDLLKRDLGKTMIFCDSLDLGADIGKRYGIDWIHGGTRNRMDIIRKNKRVVISRVGDEGISVPTLDTIIEIDFLGGSRMQALQRAGRLSHRAIKAEQEPAVHHILMTEEELDKYNKRLLAYYDKGYKLDYLYHN